MPRSLPATSSWSPLAVGHSARRRRASTSVCAGKRRASAERPPSAAGTSGKSEKPMTSRGRLVRRSVYMELCTRRRAGSRPSRSSASTSAPGGERGEVSEAAGARVRLRGAARARRRGSRPKGLDVLLLHRCRAQGSARQVLGSVSRTVYTAGVGLQQVLRIYVLSMVQTSVPPGACNRAHSPGLLGRSRARTPLLSQTGAGVLTRGGNPALRIRANRLVTAACSR